MGDGSSDVGAPIRRALVAAFRAAGEANGRLVLLTGDAGIGKTTAARELAELARRSGATVRWAACWPGGATVAHGPWVTLLSGLGGAGARAVGTLSTAPGDETAAATSARASAYAEVAQALEAASASRTIVLVLDDLQWADEGTVQLLAAVVGNLPGLPVLVVGTYRDTEVAAGSPLRQLGASAERFALTGLDVGGVGGILAEIVGGERAAALAAETHRRTGGNPFLVVQLGRLFAGDPSALEHGTLPAGARDLLEGRLAGLATADRGVVVAAAVLGSRFTGRDVAAVLGAEATSGALERAAGLRILERAPGVGVWSFVHELFRQAVLDAADPEAVRRLHRRAAASLAAVDAEPAVVARHLLEAADGGSADAAWWLVRAGDRAISSMAWEEAKGHYERALAALPVGDRGHDDTRAAALLGLGRARLLDGDGAGAGRAFVQAAELGDRIGSVSLLAQAALAFSLDLSGFEVRLYDQRQIDLLERAARALAGSGLLGLEATVLARLSVALSLAASPVRRLQLAERSVELARQADEPAVLARALAAHCDAMASPDHVDRRLREASEVVAIGERVGDGPLELLGRRLRYVALLERGDAAGAHDEIAAFARRADIVANPLYSWCVPLWRGQEALVAGDLAGCEQAIAETAACGIAAGSTNAPLLATVLGLVLSLVRGDFVQVIERIDSLVDDAPELVPYITTGGAFARALALAGDASGATAVLDRWQGAGLDHVPFDGGWLSELAMVVAAATLVDHPVLADAVARLEPYAELVAFEGIGAGLYGAVAGFLAAGARALGRHDDAERHARQALEINRRFGGVLLAEAHRTLADVLGGGPEAAWHDAAANDAYRTLGLDRLVRRGPSGSARPSGGARASESEAADVAPAASPVNELRRDGEVWQVSFAGQTTIVKHSKGVADLAVLLASPGREVHVAELEGVPVAAVTTAGDEVLDRQAIAAYRERLADLATEIDDADASHDLGRAEHARIEYDALVDQLAGAVGLAGRARRSASNPVERLRKAVSARIRDAIRRIDAVHPALARHLTNAVRTGTYCSYQPEQPTAWRCQTRSGAQEA